MLETTATERVLTQTTIEGLDILEALGRMGNSSKMYLRIIHSFITNMPKTLNELAAVTPETLPAYAILVHGAKGSCYGIGANLCGDLAKNLEMASKAGDWDTVQRDNDGFLASVRSLLVALEQLEAAVEAAEQDEAVVITALRPDPLKLSALLAATQDFDLEQMQELLDELTAVTYEQGGDVTAALKESFAIFDYQAIEETIIANI
jgi:HPt (histidine-containing phosphotransfer) domain-containing protein